MIVHLGGTMDHLETVTDGVRKSFGPPAPGQVWFVPPESDYRSVAQGDTVHYLVVEFDLDRVVDRDTYVPPIADGFASGRLLSASLRVRDVMTRQADPLVLEDLAAELCSDFVEGTNRSKTREASAAGREPGRLAESDVQQIEHYVWAHLDGSFSIDDLAANLGMSPRSFRSRFKATFGRSPAQYVIDQRIRRAQLLMLRTDDDLTELAWSLGFSSHSHFTATYRERVGEVPSAYRKTLEYLETST